MSFKKCGKWDIFFWEFQSKSATFNYMNDTNFSSHSKKKLFYLSIPFMLTKNKVDCYALDGVCNSIPFNICFKMRIAYIFLRVNPIWIIWAINCIVHSTQVKCIT